MPNGMEFRCKIFRMRVSHCLQIDQIRYTQFASPLRNNIKIILLRFIINYSLTLKI